MKNILIIEDSMSIAMTLEMMLTGEGYKTMLAYEIGKALELAKTANPDLIILDINIPGGGGLLIAEELTKSEEAKKVPIIVFTAVSMDEAKEKTMMANVKHYVSKPDTDTLISYVNELLAE